MLDGSIREVEKGSKVGEIAKSISTSLAKKTVGAFGDGRQVDVSFTVARDCSIEFITIDSETGVHILRHSTTHIMAQAVLRLFPDTKLGIGPVIENGFIMTSILKDLLLKKIY